MPLQIHNIFIQIIQITKYQQRMQREHAVSTIHKIVGIQNPNSKNKGYLINGYISRIKATGGYLRHQQHAHSNCLHNEP